MNKIREIQDAVQTFGYEATDVLMEFDRRISLRAKALQLEALIDVSKKSVHRAMMATGRRFVRRLQRHDPGVPSRSVRGLFPKQIMTRLSKRAQDRLTRVLSSGASNKVLRDRVRGVIKVSQQELAAATHAVITMIPEEVTQ